MENASAINGLSAADVSSGCEPWPDSLQAFLADHVPCLLERSDAVLLQMNDAPWWSGGFRVTGICGCCGVTSETSVGLWGFDPGVGDLVLVDYVGRRYHALFADDAGRFNCAKFGYVAARLNALLVDVYAQCVARPDWRAWQ